MVKGKSRDKFICDNLNLVHSICRRFVNRGIEYDDLFQIGCIGLVKAVDNFDEERNLQFSTYAFPVIMGEIKRVFRDGGSIKVSRSIKELYIKVCKARDEIEKEKGESATVSEIAESLNVSTEDVTEAISATLPTVSITQENKQNEECEIPLADNTQAEYIYNKVMMDTAFKYLTETEQKIIKYRYYNALSQSETAKKLSVSQVQVSRTERKILLKLREILSK